MPKISNLELARTGVLPSRKDAGRVFILARDINAFLLKKTVVRADPAADEEREVARVTAAMARKSA